jgi:hypothetical protein
LDRSNMRVHKVAREIITTWLKSERHQAGY